MGMANISIQPAGLSDLDAIVDVHSQARTAYYRAGRLLQAEIDDPGGLVHRREAWARAIESGEKTVLCALQADKVVGAVAMGPPLRHGADAATVGELYQIHVLPSHWGQGVGGQLHAAFVQFLREGQLPTGQVEAWEQNHSAQAFYTRYGWKPDGHRRPGPGHSSYIRMRLDVTAA
ncbi:GNAT family N-acetyltransferase [Streptomyces inhibens]|uniref:GNAT family N-acetyltransferase n=1 Tax=Streptomyces inhibens TaxID=2293571 RepID=UPI001EE6AE75|nr:GNAT family N-acetyltransferase [Streptomyces inhibens]UKY54709.1 GNAT family N-acetyltransferase [Streptomyces inhibens]